MFLPALTAVFFAIFINLNSAIPVNNGVTSSHTLTKRLEKPPVPSAEDLKSHLLRPDRDECMFYTGGTLDAADTYSGNNDKVLLGDLDKDGWAAPTVEDANGDEDYADDCPMSFKFQEPYINEGVNWGEAERGQYWDNLSQAFTEICTGDILLAVPESTQIPEDSVFARIEWPAIKANLQINRVFWASFNGNNPNPTSGPDLAWQRCGTGDDSSSEEE